LDKVVVVPTGGEPFKIELTVDPKRAAPGLKETCELYLCRRDVTYQAPAK
jgi:hypothetical protein